MRTNPTQSAAAIRRSASTLTRRHSTSPEIARALGVKPETVKTHVKADIHRVVGRDTGASGRAGQKEGARLSPRPQVYCWSMIFSENRFPPPIKSGAGFFGIML
jgi:hypothetical protein